MAGSSFGSRAAEKGITKSPSPLKQLLVGSSKKESRPASGGSSLRMLVSISVMGSIWEVRVIVSAQETVKGVIKAGLAALCKEGRSLPSGYNAEAYELLASRFSLQSLNMDAQLMDLGARSFVLKRKNA